MRAIKLIGIMIVMVVGWSCIVYAESVQFSETYNKVMKTLEELTPSQSFKVVVGTEKDKYEILEPIEVRFQSEKACYLTLMDISTNGDITFLAPSKNFPENKIEAQRVYSTKTDFKLGGMKTAPPAGYETFNLFCTSEKIDFFDADFQKEAFYTIPSYDEERLETLLKALESLKQQEWAGTSTFFLIKGRSAIPGGEKALPKRGILKPIDATGSTGRMLWPVDATGSTGHTEDDNKPKSNE